MKIESNTNCNNAISYNQSSYVSHASASGRSDNANEQPLNSDTAFYDNDGVIYTQTALCKYESEDGSVVFKISATNQYENQNIQSKLSELGFYDGPMDGNLSSNKSRSALSLFQKLYGVSDENGTYGNKTKNKLNTAYTMYRNVTNCDGFSSIKKTYGLTNSEIANAAKIWTFLRVGMSMDANHAAGIMGNMFLESNFSPDNAQNSKGYPGNHNPEYTYKYDDEVAYGLIQWKDDGRKKGLLSKANELGISVSNLNAQLAFLKQELTSSVAGNDYYKRLWDNIKGLDSVEGICDAFRANIEGTDGDIQARRNYSTAIFNAFGAF